MIAAGINRRDCFMCIDKYSNVKPPYVLGWTCPAKWSVSALVLTNHGSAKQLYCKSEIYEQNTRTRKRDSFETAKKKRGYKCKQHATTNRQAMSVSGDPTTFGMTTKCLSSLHFMADLSPSTRKFNCNRT